MARSAGEVTAPANRSVILSLWASELQTQPKAQSKVRCAKVTDDGHLIGTAEQDLHAHVEADLSVTTGRRAGPCIASKNTDTTAEGAPAPMVRVGMTSGNRTSSARLLRGGDG